MNNPDLPDHAPPALVGEFEIPGLADWDGALALADLLKRVNRAARLLHLRPEQGGGDARVSNEFSPRSFRHYQTLGCIDPPQRQGGRVVYGQRHFVQSLLVRKLLWERLPAEKIAGLLAGRGTEEMRRMLLGGIEMVARPADRRDGPGAPAQREPETWKRVVFRPGVELHLCENLPKPKPGELKGLLAAVETELRKRLR